MSAIEPDEDAVDVMVAEWTAAVPEEDFASLHTVSRMLRLLRIFENGRRAVLDSVDLEPWSFDVLAVLRRHPDGEVSAGELTSALLVTSGTMSTWLKSLEKRGWIVRSSGSADRRRVIVKLSNPGLVSFDQVLGQVLQCQRELVDPLSEEEAGVLSLMLRKMLSGQEGTGLAKRTDETRTTRAPGA